METNSLWLNKTAILLTFISTWSICPAFAGPVCPLRDRQPLRFVDVFDGPPEQMAILVPDKAGERSGYWSLDYVYDAGRVVVVRCKYADKQTSDIKLSNRVHRCDYKIDAKKTLTIDCK